MIEREYEIMSKLGQNTSFPVPRTYFLDTSDEVCGTPYFACEYVDGRFYKDCRMEKAPNADARKASFDSLIRNTAHFHSIDFESIGLGEYGKKGGYLARQTKVWTSQYRAAAEATNSKNEDIEKLISWLPTALPEDDDVSTLVHGDLRVDNCIFDADTNEVKAVLDWELSTIGHPGAPHPLPPPSSTSRLGLSDLHCNLTPFPPLSSNVTTSAWPTHPRQANTSMRKFKSALYKWEEEEE